jgi:hypothetical protein
MSSISVQSTNRRKIILRCLLLCIFLLFSSCTIAGNQNVLETTTPNTITPTPILSKTPTNIPTSAMTPEPTKDYVNLIQNIDERVLVYQKIYNDEKKCIQFSSLDFLSFDGTGRDIRKVYYELPLPVGNSIKIWNFIFYNNSQSFIYTTYNLTGTKLNMYKYDIETAISKQITSNISFNHSMLSSTEKYISYTTMDDSAYIIDLSGYGYQYAPEINIYSNVLFAPDENSIAFIGNTSDNLDFHLFVVPLNEPNNSTQVTIDPVKKWAANATGETYQFSWAPDSKSIVYTKIFPGPKYSFCQINTESQQEICFPEHPFYHIGNFELSTENLLAVSGLEIPDEDKECVVCKSEELISYLYLLDFGSGKMSVITDDPHSNAYPMWIGNDQFILYQHYENENTQIYITDKTGSFHQPLTSSEMDTYLLN